MDVLDAFLPFRRKTLAHIEQAFKSLLETKHLYQRIRLDFEDILFEARAQLNPEGGTFRITDSEHLPARLVSDRRAEPSAAGWRIVYGLDQVSDS
jgi:hypothetical protein